VNGERGIVDDARIAVQDSRLVEGTIVGQLPSGLYTVEVEGPHGARAAVTAHIGGGSDRNFIRLLVGDRVLLELMPRDRTRGRVTKKV
jgi:translation initiation factor IF-1